MSTSSPAKRAFFQPTRPFVPAKGLDSGHAQTLYPVFFRPTRGRHPRKLPLVRERWHTPDGDFVDVDRLRPRVGREDASYTLLLHGLEGSSSSGYIVECLQHLAARGQGAIALNFRSCSGEPNLTCPAYSSGDLRDTRLAVRVLRSEGHHGPINLVGFSLGGNVTLKFLANAEESREIHRAAAISVPFDLDACVERIDHLGGLNHVYRERFLRPMKAKAAHKAARFEGQLDGSAIKRSRTMREFDRHVTAPTFGYASAEDYYAQASSGRDLHRIETPTLLVTSDDDPLAPANLLPTSAEDNPHLVTLRTPKGGHVGFVEGSVSNPRYWAEEQAIDFVLRRD